MTATCITLATSLTSSNAQFMARFVLLMLYLFFDKKRSHHGNSFPPPRHAPQVAQEAHKASEAPPTTHASALQVISILLGGGPSFAVEPNDSSASF
ncbi:membrane-associated protein, putative [Bodo saltans]|uniref:Membrane-associated protein, putative n=1 Tax=Bodo saltans TaxID=75058 RepID=A0A0S4JD93_BODSA|nr:membrane-associated protein, putative [Bodo saltans]|eukprot:CUG88058.1 membrane-associated protein, putative [Bodo saltans]